MVLPPRRSSASTAASGLRALPSLRQQQIVDYKQVDAHVHQFKGSSSREMDYDGFVLESLVEVGRFWSLARPEHADYARCCLLVLQENYKMKLSQRLLSVGVSNQCWLLGVFCDLKLPRSPPIATVPLGTGNNVPFAFGWGKKNPNTNSQYVAAFLDQVRNAKEMKIDSWHIMMRMRAPEKGSCDPIAPLELPHSLHVFHRVTQDDTLNREGFHTYRGGFWNYFSMGKRFS